VVLVVKRHHGMVFTLLELRVSEKAAAQNTAKEIVHEDFP
jgi:hypothetical protein